MYAGGPYDPDQTPPTLGDFLPRWDPARRDTEDDGWG